MYNHGYVRIRFNMKVIINNYIRYALYNWIPNRYRMRTDKSTL